MGVAFLTITAIGWGLNWPAIKFVLADWPPLFSRGIAGIIGASVLALLCVFRGDSLRLPRNAMIPLAFASFTNVFAWMGFTTIAMKYLSVAEASLLVYTMPIWVSVLSWPILGLRPTPRNAFALALGCAGLFLLFYGQSITFSDGKFVGIMLTLSAALLFALGSIVNRKSLPLSPYALVTWQVGLACVPMAVLGFLFERPTLSALSTSGWTALIYMALIPMALCYVTWFGTLRHMQAANAAIGTLAVPVIGVVSAAAVLGEPLGAIVALAVALTILGVWLALSGASKRAE